MSEIVDENKLVKIANILQLMVGKNTNYQSYDEISPANSRSTKKHPPFLYLLDGLQKLCNL